MFRIELGSVGLVCLLVVIGTLGSGGCSDTPDAKPLPAVEGGTVEGGTVEGGTVVGETVEGGTVEGGEAKMPSGEELEKAAGQAADAVADGVAVAWEKASAAMKNFEGGKEMLGSMREMYGSAKTSLSEVTNEESAMKAKTELDNWSKKIEEWKPQLSEMSEEVRAGAKRFFDHVAEKLSSMAEQLNDNEWVNTILKPKLRELIEQLQSLG